MLAPWVHFAPLTPIILRLFDSQALTQLALFELVIAAAIPAQNSNPETPHKPHC